MAKERRARKGEDEKTTSGAGRGGGRQEDRRGLRRVCKRRAARGGCTAPTFRGEAGDPIAMHHPVLPTTTRYSRTYATPSPLLLLPRSITSLLLSPRFFLSPSHFRFLSSPTLFFFALSLLLRSFSPSLAAPFPPPPPPPPPPARRSLSIFYLFRERHYIPLDCPCPGFPSAYFDRRRRSSFSPLLDASSTPRFRFTHAARTIRNSAITSFVTHVP